MSKVVLKVGDTVVIPYSNNKTGVIIKEDIIKVSRFLVEKADGSRFWQTEKQLVQNQENDEGYDEHEDEIQNIVINAPVLATAPGF